MQSWPAGVLLLALHVPPPGTVKLLLEGNPVSDASGIVGRIHPEAIKALLEGNPTAWAVVIGMVAGFVLGFAVGKVKEFEGTRTSDPAEIVAEVKKRRARCLVAAVVFVPVILVGIVVGLALEAPIAAGIAVFLGCFLLMLICTVSWKCPACGGTLGGKEPHPKACPKCGVPFE